MDITQYINTPANTLETTPLQTTIKLTRGRLTGGTIYFPKGPRGVLHFIARIGVHQIIPFNAGQNFRLNDCIVPLSLGIDLRQPPYQLVCETWNDSITYAHALTILLHIDPRFERDKDLKTLIEKFWYFGGK